MAGAASPVIILAATGEVHHAGLSKSILTMDAQGSSDERKKSHIYILRNYSKEKCVLFKLSHNVLPTKQPFLFALLHGTLFLPPIK
jgi:hypothetical protein